MCCGESGGCCRFRGGCVHCLGWGLIVLGVVGAVLAVVLDVLYAQYWFAPITLINAPIWAGVFVIVTGGLAVCSGRNPDKKGKMVAVLVLSIFATMAATCVWILAVIGVFIDGAQCEYFRQSPSYYWNLKRGSLRDMGCTPAYAVHAVLIVIGLLEVAFALAVSIMSCCGTCCAPRDDTQGAVYRADGQQVIIVQGGAGPGQPSPQPGHKPYPVQQMPAQQVYPGQQQLYPGQPSPGQQPYPVQPSPGQQPPYPVQQQPYPQVQYSAPPPEQNSAIPSAPAPSYSEAVKGE
ncbi:uncharacterized protein LOC144923330 [Branchiostoma floridae x Branchiostoma belcheri]